MRDLGAALGTAFQEGTFKMSAYLDLYYDNVRTMSNVQVLPDWQQGWRRSANVPMSISCTAILQDPEGESQIPRTRESPFAPYGQEATFNIRFDAGDWEETVQIGRFRVEDVDAARDNIADTPLGPRVASTEIDITLYDSLRAVELNGFSGPTQAPQNSTCWSELGRLTTMRLKRTLTDVGMVSSIAYELNQGGRLKACQQIADRLGGDLQVTWDGALTVVPYTGVATGIVLETGDFGRVVNAVRAMTAEGVYNEVVGNFSNDKGEAILVPSAQQTTGILRVDGPFGKRTRYYSSEFVKTHDAARSALAKILQQSLQSQRSRITVRTIMDLRVEPGDNIIVREGRDSARVTVAERRVFGDGRMELDVEVMSDVFTEGVS